MLRTITLVSFLLIAASWTGQALAAGDDVATRRAEILAKAEALATNAAGAAEGERLQQFIDLFFEYSLLEHPEFATLIGLPGDHGRWTDNSMAADARRDRENEMALEVLRSIPRAELTGDDRLNYDLLEQQLVDGVAGQRFPDELLAINQMGGVQQDIAQMLSMMPTGNITQLDAVLSRLCAGTTLIENDLAKLAKGLEAGVTPPRVTLRDVPDQITNILTEDPMASPLLRSFADMPESVSAADQERLQVAATACFRDGLAPAFRRLHTFLVETYLPAARESIGMTAVPDGEAWYAFNVRQMTTTDLTPKAIHEIGLSEVARIRSEMDRVIETSGFEGDFEAFTDFLRTDPQFYFEDAGELLASYRDIAKRADAELVKLFGTLPRLPYGVEPVPSYAEKSQTTAYYQPGSLEAGRPGTFFANTYDLASRPKWEMEALTLHEAVPGHHLQIALGQELDDQPWFRRFGGYTAYVEGWGLYSESLGEAMGFYQDPYAKFGQLTYEMWRAIRLVVDTGMHALGWSRQEAIDYFKANTGKAEHDIVVEVDRYIVWPGQALAYKIGELKLKELRAHAEAALGESFDIRAFHDQVLGNGAVPLGVLEAHIREWVAAQLEEAPDVAAPGTRG